MPSGLLRIAPGGVEVVVSGESTLVVVDRPGELPPEVGGAKVLTASSYLSDDTPFAHGTRVINLCRYDRYQSDGYYVSLLAEARGHVSLPEMRVLGDLQGDAPATLTGRSGVRRSGAVELAAHPRKTYTLDAIFGVDPSHGTTSSLPRCSRGCTRRRCASGFVKRKNRWQVGACARPGSRRAVGKRTIAARRRARVLSRADRAADGDERTRAVAIARDPLQRG
jgi:hypothetical protein